MHLPDLIRFDAEHTGLDFKRTQYVSAKHDDVLKDVMALANAEVDGDRYIIIGVEPRAGGPNRVVGVPTGQVVDDAVYQQLVHENIEPDIGFAYETHDIGGQLVCMFRIFDCRERPYVMKKDYGNTLRRGDGWIRKGSHQLRLMREDLERIYAARQQQAGPLELTFEKSASTHLDVRVTDPADLLPSDRAETTIKEILAERARLEPLLGALSHPLDLAIYPGHATSYEQRPTETLRADLERVREAYRDDDAYHVYEELATPMQLLLHNRGGVCLEGAKLELVMIVPDGVLVADRVHTKPIRDPMMMALCGSSAIGYPHVERDGYGRVIARCSLGDVRPGESIAVFGVPLRVTALAEAAGKQAMLSARVLGKNLASPYVTALSIRGKG